MMPPRIVGVVGRARLFAASNTGIKADAFKSGLGGVYFIFLALGIYPLCFISFNPIFEPETFFNILAPFLIFWVG